MRNGDYGDGDTSNSNIEEEDQYSDYLTDWKREWKTTKGVEVYFDNFMLVRLAKMDTKPKKKVLSKIELKRVTIYKIFDANVGFMNNDILSKT